MKAIDQMDKGLDFLGVALEALSHRDDWSDDEEVIECIRQTVEWAISTLTPVREFVSFHGGGNQAVAVRRLAELMRSNKPHVKIAA